MEFDQATLRPTYRFRKGVPGSSYALEMAGRLGFNDAIMDRAKGYLGQQQTHLEALLAQLESSVQQHRLDLDEVRREKLRLDELVTRYEAKVAALSSELREMKRKALDEAEKIVERANAVIEKSVREIREAGAEKTKVRSVREEVTRMREEIAESRASIVEPSPEPEEGRIDAGSLVRLADGSNTGEVESVAADGKSAVVIFGSVKIRVPLKDLKLSRKEVRRESSPAALPSEKPEPPQQDLDLRGLTGEEALPLVDKFIDSAVLAGLHRVDIIHGKGTGALRKKVSEFLAHHPRVKSFRLGEWNEGGTGATVVELEDN
jgi:DNA mismatch repair protein MutS2